MLRAAVETPRSPSLSLRSRPATARRPHAPRGSRRRARASIEILEARRLLAASPIQVSGSARWTAPNGAVSPIPLASVELRVGFPGGASTVVATGVTSDSGSYSLSFPHEGAPVDVFVRIVASSPYAEVKPEFELAAPYSLDTDVASGILGGSSLTINALAGSTLASHQAFGVHAALVAYGTYASFLAGANLPSLPVYFPTAKAGADFTPNPNRINLSEGRANWDVIGHEYGHYVMQAYSFVSTPGGGHSFGRNNAATLGKAGGVGLAWSEGWATYFALAGQVATGADSLGIPHVGDTLFEGYMDIEATTGVGEDDELSVANVLWDLYDSARDGDDVYQMSDVSIFDLSRRRLITRVDQLWTELATNKTPAELSRLGALFAQATIAPEALYPDDGAGADPSNPPTFAWASNGGGGVNPLNDFVIQFYTPDMAQLVFEKALGDTNAFTPTSQEWIQILGGRGSVKWVVQGRNTGSPATPSGDPPGGCYWSEARSVRGVDVVFAIDDSGSMTQEIEAVKEVIQRFLDDVAAAVAQGGRAPVMQLITFDDVVTVQFTTDDIDVMRAAIGELVADGGGDCPELSDMALDLASETVRRGGVVVLATDAPAEGVVDMGQVLNRLVQKQITVYSLISGVGCEDEPAAAPAAASSGAAAFVGPPAPARYFASAAPSLAGPAPEDAGTFDDEPPRGPIDVVTSPYLDRVGGSIATATRIGLGRARSGWVSVARNLQDMFVLSVQAGVRYVVRTETGETSSIKSPGYLIYDSSGRPTNIADQDEGAGSFAFTATTTGDVYIRVRSFNFSEDPPAWYSFRVEADPLAEVVEPTSLFGAIARATGGAMVYEPTVKSGDQSAYVAALANLLDASRGAGVVAASPSGLPAGSPMTIELVGRGVDWSRGDVSVHFPSGDVQVLGVEVLSAGTLRVTLLAPFGAAPGPRDVLVATVADGQATTVGSRGLVRVVAAPTAPAITQVVGDRIEPGATATVTVRGHLTGWAATPTVRAGEGLRVLAVRVVSPTELQVDLAADPDAGPGPRDLEVEVAGQPALLLADALRVGREAPPAPQVVLAAPDWTSVRDATIYVEIAGIATRFEAGRTTVDFGPDVTVESVEVLGPDRLRVAIRIAAGAAVGRRAVVVATDGQSALPLAGFVIADPIDLGPGADPGGGPGTDPGTDPGTGPGSGHGTDPGTNPGTDPGGNPGTDPGTNPGPGADPGAPAKVVRVVRQGPPWAPARLLVSFDGDVDPATVGRSSFAISTPGRDGVFGTRDDRFVRIARTLYDPASRTLRLAAARRLPLVGRLRLAARGVRDLAGRSIDGDRDGLPGGDALVPNAARPRPFAARPRPGLARG